MHIRLATTDDADKIAKIYAYYVLKTAITFEYDAPDAKQMSERIATTLRRYPFIVAVKDEQILGYAYASVLKNRTAYDWAAESSIYLSHDFLASGIGGALYDALERLLRAQGVASVFACIAAGHELEQSASILFHSKRGFVEAGRWLGCGFKFNRWYDALWMQKQLSDPGDEPAPFRAINTLKISEIEKILGEISV